MKKILGFVIIATLMISLGKASPVIEDVNFPESVDAGEQIVIDTDVTFDDLDSPRVVIEWDEQQPDTWDSTSKTVLCESPSCQISWDGTYHSPMIFDSAGSYDFTVEAISGGNSDFRFGTVEVEKTEWDIISFETNVEDDGIVEITGELDSDLPEDFECRWSTEENVSEGDTMERVSDSIFEAEQQFIQGSHTVYMDCFDNGDSVTTEVASSTFEVERDDPDIELEIDPNPAQVSQEVNFDASGSSSNDGTPIEEYRLSFSPGGEEEVSEDPTFTRSFDEPRSTTAVLEVETEAGSVGTTTKDYVVEEPPEDPLADLSVSPQIGISGTEFEFDASESSSRDETEISEFRFDIDGDGSFDFETEDSVVSETVDETGELNALVEVETEAGNTAEAEQSYEVLEEDKSSLTVNVEDEEGNPLDANVTLTNDQDYESETGDDGSTSFEVEEGSYELTVSKEGYLTDTREIEIGLGESKQVDVVLEKKDEEEEKVEDEEEKGTLKVETVDEDDDPLSDVEISAENDETKTKKSNHEGKAEFLLNEGSYQVDAEKDDYYSDSRTVKVEGNETREIELKLGKRPNLEVTRFDSPGTVCRGEEFRVDFSIRNNQDQTENVRVSGNAPGSRNIGRDVTIGPGSTTSSYITLAGIKEEGIHSIDLNVENSDSLQKTNQIFVEDCDVDRAETEASALSINTDRSKVQVGETVRLTGYLDGVRGASNIDVFIGDDEETTITTTRGGYYSTTINPDSVGTLRLAVSGGGHTQSKTIEVLPTAAIYSMRTKSTPYAGDPFEVCGEVETQQSARVTLEREGVAIDSKNSNGETCFEVREDDAGDYQYTMRVNARGSTDSKTRRFTVNPADEQVSSFPQQIAMERSGPGELKVELYNNGQAAADYETEISGIPDHYVDQTRKNTRLSPGRTETQYFFLTPTEEGEFTPKVTVKRDGETIFEEEKRMTSGGTTQQHTRTIFDRLKDWIRVI